MRDPQLIAGRLLQAHLAHQLNQLEPGRLCERIDREVDALFCWFAEVKLEDLVSREQIVGVIERYVIELKGTGAFAELAGEMSRHVLSSSTSSRTRVDEVLRPEAFAQFADKLFAQQALWNRLIHLTLQSDSCATLLSRALQRAVIDVVLPGEDLAAQATFVDGLLSKLRPLIAERAAPLVSARLESLIKRMARASEERLLLALDPEAARALIDDVWDGVAPMRLFDAFALLGENDLEDFVVLGYEFWLRYRKTPYFRDISTELVDLFFDKYGEYSPAEVLEEMGVNAGMVGEEAQRFIAPLMRHATVTGFLEARLRESLEPFYSSAGVTAILTDE